MAIYANLPKLGRTQTPSGNTYALIDVDGRSILAPNFSSQAEYLVGDHVIYNDDLYRCKANTTGDWNASKWDNVTIDTEIKRLEGIITGGIHYRGKTSTGLYDGAVTNPVTINGESYTAINGDLVIVGLSSVAVTYSENTAYDNHTYIVYGGTYYISNETITAVENTSFEAIEGKLNTISSEPEFLYDGSVWNILGSIAEGLGTLAFKDSAQGTYVKPTGTGSVAVNIYGANTKKLTTTTVTGTNGTMSATYIEGLSSANFATIGSEFTVAVKASSATYFGNADVGSSVSVGIGLSGSTTFALSGITATVEGDCLTFTNATTGSFTLDISSITPATSAGTARSIYGVDTTVQIVGCGTATSAITGISYSTVNPAKEAANATTVATGGLEAGEGIVTSLTSTTSTATVSVNVETSSITVK